MPTYGFVIDLKRCYGCYSCQVTCKAEHLTPPGVSWARVLKGERGKYPAVIRQSLPIMCMQCADPECMKVCPTGATEKRADGIVTVDKEACVGCKYCAVACPYGARNFTDEWTSYFAEDQPLSPLEEYARKQWLEKYGEGTSTKCDFCIDRVEKGLKPACAVACPASARIFGDLDDPNSEVSLLIKSQRGFQLAPEFGTNPRVYYLPPR
jgi:Fe-S-cluster-containing dehydrogenase component